jgi:hypothetical protein
MAELKAVELVDINKVETETEEKRITLKEDFKWFLTPQFKELLEGFEPSDNSEFIEAYCKKYNITLEEKTPPSNMEQEYVCYECARINHGIPIYQTDSKTDYEKHRISSGHQGPCYPGVADIEKHRWIAQGRAWEL